LRIDEKTPERSRPLAVTLNNALPSRAIKERSRKMGMQLHRNHRKQAIVTAFSLAFACWSGLAIGQTSTAGMDSSTNMNAASRGDTNEARNAMQHVDGAVNVVHRMESEAGMDKLLQQAKGVFIVPSFGRAALVIGAGGGPGVLLLKRGTTWSDPAFYTIGGVSAGAQAGIQAGSIAYVLNSDKAIDNFTRNNKFSIDANAGLTIINWSKEAERAAGRGDVVAWTDTKGLYGALAVGITDIHYDARETSAYYNQKVAANDVVNGKVKNPHSATLKQALAAASTATSTGSSGTSSTGTTSGNQDYSPSGRSNQK
jgi:SH3 domain-containing YSC84-like protein 1